ELFFRGILLQVAWRATESAWLAVLVSALAFGAIHLSVPPSVLPLCTFGIVLGYVRLRYRSLAACVLIHMLFNARPIVLLLVAPEAA
ncbi:MAG: CPBP family intramembrane metalloprotease, partial [Phycisphaerae bacterium]|nr:CPBP family intramembrane metalloprotease [Phycisphaerae bacterium]